MASFIQENFWYIFMICMGVIPVLFSFSAHFKQQKLKKTGQLTEASFIGYSTKNSSSSSIKAPIFGFWHQQGTKNRHYKVLGKTNAPCKTGETTPVYYNPENPEKEYYLPKKDFLMKYVLFFIGSFFIILGSLYLMRKSNINTKSYFLYLFVGLFVGTLILFIIGKVSNFKKE